MKFPVNYNFGREKMRGDKKSRSRAGHDRRDPVSPIPTRTRNQKPEIPHFFAMWVWDCGIFRAESRNFPNPAPVSKIFEQSDV